MNSSAPYLVLALFVAMAVVGAVRGLRRRGWVPGEADVTKVTFSRTAFSGDVVGGSLYVVEARVRTRDGRQQVGQAQGFYGDDSPQWQGTTRPAWHDPRDPGRFTLVAPARERGITGDDLFVYAIIAVIAAVAIAVVVL